MPNKLSSKLGGTFGKLLTNVIWQSSGEVVLTKGIQAYKNKQTNTKRCGSFVASHP